MLFICGLFNYAITSLGYVALDDRMNTELEMIWMAAANLRYYPSICLEGLRKTMKNLNQESWSLGRDLNPGSLKYKAGMLTTWL
jgi:hypothetical protein